MAQKTFKFTDPQGRTLSVNSPDGSIPTEQEIDRMFASKYGDIKKPQESPARAFYRERIAPAIVHPLSDVAFGIPKLTARMAPGAEEALYPEQKTTSGKIIRGVTGIPAFILGGIGKTAGKIGTKIIPRLAQEGLKRKALRATLEGLTAGALIPPEEGVIAPAKRIEQGLTYGGLSGGLPVAGAGIKIAAEKMGTGIVKTFIPKTIAERGLQKGFVQLLNPEYYKERLPQNFVNRMTNIFNVAKNDYGEKVRETINKPKYRNMQVDISRVQDEIRSIFPKGIHIEDIEASGMQKKILSNLSNKVLSIGQIPKGIPSITEKQMTRAFQQRWKSIPELWKLRQEIDQTIYSHKWNIEAKEYLNKLRGILNNPIRNAGKDIQKVFDEYSFIMQGKEELSKKFTDIVTRRATGEVFSQDLELFINTLMSPQKSETRALLSRIDPKLSEIMFDVASARVLGKQASSISPYYNLMSKIVSPYQVAKLANLSQKASRNIEKSMDYAGRGYPINQIGLIEALKKISQEE